MDVKHIILEADSISKMQELLNSNAQNGFKAVSLNSYFDSNYGKTYYTALMARYGSLDADSNPM